MKKGLVLLLVLSLSLHHLPIQAQAPSTVNWKLAKQANGIQVYTADVDGSNRKYIKVKADLEGSLNKVKAVFQNIAQQKAWVYSTKQAYLIQQVDDHTLLYYNETSLPWPASNRDVAINMKLTEDNAQHKLVITQEGKPSAAPTHKGVVRIPHLSANWQFHEVANNQLTAEYYLDLDPGGSLPTWVINMFIAKGPYETFMQLRQMLKQ